LRYGIIFWGEESENQKAFKLQKRILHSMKGVKKRKLCREMFREYKITYPEVLSYF
jgi:hypothetical protein